MDTEPVVRDATVTLDGVRFHYRDWGDPEAPALVLLHAYTQHARGWDTVAKGLADHFRVLALDQRGHGESDWAADYHELRLVADLAGFVETLGLATISLMGFSIGGSAAISYAQLYPDRVERQVAFECFTDAEALGDAPYWHAMQAHLGLLRALPETFDTPEAAVAAFRPLAPHAAENEIRHWMLGGLKQGTDGRWTWRYDPIFRTPASTLGRLNASPDVLAGRLAGVACPTLLLAGEESWMVEPTRRMVALNPQARMVTVPQAGHWIPLDNPGGFLKAVRGFLTGDA
jgi:esterase